MSRQPKEPKQPKAPKEPKEKKNITFGSVMRNIWKVIQMVAKWMYQLRSILLAIPVVAIALRQAIKNMSRLPNAVGIFLMESGRYQFMFTRSVAVMGPLAITAVCILLMFCSRRVLYPWLVSLFTLVIPWVIWVTNMFAG